jgi:hypothetical protein
LARFVFVEENSWVLWQTVDDCRQVANFCFLVLVLISIRTTERYIDFLEHDNPDILPSFLKSAPS